MSVIGDGDSSREKNLLKEEEQQQAIAEEQEKKMANLLHDAEESAAIATPQESDAGAPPTFEVAALRKFLAQKNNSSSKNSDLVEAIHVEINAQPSLGNQLSGNGKSATRKAKGFLSGIVNKVNKHFLIDSINRSTNPKEQGNAIMPATAAPVASKDTAAGQQNNEQKNSQKIDLGVKIRRRAERTGLVQNLVRTSTAAVLDSVAVVNQAIGSMNQRRNSANAAQTQTGNTDRNSQGQQSNTDRNSQNRRSNRDRMASIQAAAEGLLTNVTTGSDLSAPTAPNNNNSGGNSPGRNNRDTRRNNNNSGR
jgi:hypothetical protein